MNQAHWKPRWGALFASLLLRKTSSKRAVREPVAQKIGSGGAHLPHTSLNQRLRLSPFPLLHHDSLPTLLLNPLGLCKGCVLGAHSNSTLLYSYVLQQRVLVRDVAPDYHNHGVRKGRWGETAWTRGSEHSAECTKEESCERNTRNERLRALRKKDGPEAYFI